MLRAKKRARALLFITVYTPLIACPQDVFWPYIFFCFRARGKESFEKKLIMKFCQLFLLQGDKISLACPVMEMGSGV
jgi:hypothetical protein